MDTFIASLYQVDFIDGETAATTRLLSIGDATNATLEFGFQQDTSNWTPGGSAYGYGYGMGGSRRALEWQRRVDHASHAAAASYAIRYPAALPMLKSGTIRVTISGGETWDMQSAVLTGVSSRPYVGNGFRTLTAYRAEVGEPVPVSGLTHEAGVRMAWILETHSEMAATTHAAA